MMAVEEARGGTHDWFRPRWRAPPTLRKLVRNRLTLAGAIISLAFVTVGLVGPVLAPYPEDASGLPEGRPRFAAPTRSHPFGTDQLGRDIFSRVLIGAGISLQLMAFTLGIALTVGMGVGMVAGFVGGWVDELAMRITDVFLALPSLILAMLVATTLGGGLFNTILAVALTWWARYARLIRGETLRLRQSLFVEAALALGAGSRRILRRHLLPNLIPTMIVQGSLDSGRVILTAAALGFLGLGARPPQPEWGLMIAIGREFLPFFWWESLFPGLVIFLVVIGLNLLGDGLRTVLDPRMRTRGE